MPRRYVKGGRQWPEKALDLVRIAADSEGTIEARVALLSALAEDENVPWYWAHKAKLELTRLEEAMKCS